jgi:hypothetical protein
LLVGVLDLLRAGRKAGRYDHLDNEASQLHEAVSGQGIPNALGHQMFPFAPASFTGQGSGVRQTAWTPGSATVQ